MGAMLSRAEIAISRPVARVPRATGYLSRAERRVAQNAFFFLLFLHTVSFIFCFFRPYLLVSYFFLLYLFSFFRFFNKYVCVYTYTYKLFIHINKLCIHVYTKVVYMYF